MKASYLYLCSGLLSAAMLVGCGGSSGGGSAATADISADNADDLSVAAAEATKTAIEAESNSGTSSIPTSFFKSTGSAPLLDKLQTGVRSATEDFSDYICDVSGEAEMTSSSSTFDTGSFIFNNCNDGDATYSGSVTFSGLSSSSFTFTYNNFIVTDNSTGQRQAVNGTVTCTNSGASCDYSGLTVGGASLSNSDFSGDDGRQYHFEGDVTVSGDNTSGWNVNATVVDPDHGAIKITARNITFGSCTNGVPTGGTITVTGNGQTATVTFIDCNSFSLNYNGSTTTHNWSSYGL